MSAVRAVEQKHLNKVFIFASAVVALWLSNGFLAAMSPETVNAKGQETKK